MVTHLKQFGFVKVFRTVFKKKDDYFAYWISSREGDNKSKSGVLSKKKQKEKEDLSKITFQDFKPINDSYWKIATYHRALKQPIGIKKFMVRKTKSILNHIFYSIRAFCKLEFKRIKGEVNNWYQIKRKLYKPIVKDFILGEMGLV